MNLNKLAEMTNGELVKIKILIEAELNKRPLKIGDKVRQREFGKQPNGTIVDINEPLQLCWVLVNGTSAKTFTAATSLYNVILDY
jgi:hypothetical protein